VKTCDLKCCCLSFHSKLGNCSAKRKHNSMYWP